MPAGEWVQPLGRTEDSRWVLIVYSSIQGWIVADGVSWRLNLAALPVIDSSALQPAPLTINTPWGPTSTPDANWVQVNNQAGFVRSGPGLQYPPLGWLLTGDVVDPVARDTDAFWVLIRYEDGYGWIWRDLVMWTFDIETLSVIDKPNLTVTPSVTPLVSYTPTLTVTPSPTLTITPFPTTTDTPRPTDTPSPTATNTDIPTATPTDTASPTATATASPTTEPSSVAVLPTNTPAPTVTNTASPTSEPAALIVTLPTALPSNTPEPPTSTPTSEPTSTNTPTATLTAEPPTNTPEPTATTIPPSPTPTPLPPTETATSAAVAMANTNPNSAAPPIASKDDGSGEESSSSFYWLIGGGAALLALLYAGVYITQSANIDSYHEGFILDTCPVCAEGELNLDERRYRVLGLPRIRRVVRCNTCRSVLRQIGRQRWRYAIDGAINPELYDQLNGRVLSEKELLELSSGMKSRIYRR